MKKRSPDSYRAAMRDKQYESDDIKVGFALTSEEKELCQQIIIFGPIYLRRQKGWKQEAVQRFMGRAEVRHELETLGKHYEDRVGLQERTQFLAQMKINAMVPSALNVVARALRGEYDDPVTGKRVDPPGKGQFEAAQLVLDRANIQGSKWAGHDNVPSIDARSINVLMGGESAGPALDAAGRAKVTGLVSALVSRARAEQAAAKKIREAEKERDNDVED